jgi:hypothetical protein
VEDEEKRRRKVVEVGGKEEQKETMEEEKGERTKQKTIPWPLVPERTISTEGPPLVDGIQCQLLWIEGCCVVSAADPLRSLISVS